MVCGIRGRLPPAYTYAVIIRGRAETPPAGVAMQAQIHGTTMPVLSVHLDPGEGVVAEAGEFSWMTDSIQISTGVGGDAGGTGPSAAQGRDAEGSSLPMST